MAKSVSVAEAQASFTECMHDVENGESVVITCDGRAVAALVPLKGVEQLARLRVARSEGGLASLAGGWEDSDELVRILDSSLRIGHRQVM
ncbi:MAG TPA: type II toxin-antitoxin system prevent-host-death family antitoxin [Longimicrobiaceae bacterium]|nr:type II toxin-antitoxin system prevent-host-death family antitoxin [Longimicrobiaceae bacterium]